MLWTPELLAEHSENAAELRRLAARLGDPVVSFWAACDTALTSVWRADLGSIDAALGEMAAVTARVGKRHPILAWVTTWYSAWRAHLGGDLEEAERLARRAAELGRAQPDASAFLADQLAAVRWDQGRLPELVPRAGNRCIRSPGSPPLPRMAVLAEADGGRPEAARALVEPSFAVGFADVPRDIVWLSTLCLYAETFTVIAGLVEANPDGRPFISQVVARAGELLGCYRKRTIPDDEAELFAAGTVARVFAHPKAVFGVAICADIDDAAVFAECAGQGARVVFEMAAPGLYGPQETRDWRAGYEWWRNECLTKLGRYARENGIAIAVATQAGRTCDEDFPGGGYVFSADGVCISSTPDWSEGIHYAALPFVPCPAN